jgi:hypothetical protein
MPSHEVGAVDMARGAAAPPCMAGDGGRRTVSAPQSGQSGAGDDQLGTVCSKRTPHAQA